MILSFARLALCCLLSLSLPFAAGCSDRVDTATPSADATATTPPVVAATEPANTAPAESAAATPQPKKAPDVIYVPTPQPVVDAMLNLAEVKKGDVLYDLGSGDGRIPITAAKRFDVRAVGIEINPERLREANANAEKEGVTDMVTFKEEDLFVTDFSEATVVTLYLLDRLNEQLRPRLLAELKPGTRIVSHAFRMGDWEPEQTVEVGSSTIYRWTVPEREEAEKLSQK